MLEWKSASRPGAIQAVQEAIRFRPEDIDYRELYYYVTNADVAKELGKTEAALGPGELVNYLSSLGLDCGRDVLAIHIRDYTIDASCSFVAKSVLERLGIPIPHWSPTDLPPKRQARHSKQTDSVRSR